MDEGISNDELSVLIGSIYDCALDASLWPAALAEISTALGGRLADLSVVNPMNGSIRLVAQHNWPTELSERCSRLAHLNPTIPLALIMPIDEPHCSSRNLDIDSFHQSKFWRECFADGDYYDYLVTVVARTSMNFGSWGVVGSRKRGAFTDRDINLARLLAPHIRRAVTFSDVLNHARAEATTLRATLDEIPLAAFVLDRKGMIEFRNHAGDIELGKQRAFKEVNNRMVGVNGETSNILNLILTKPYSNCSGINTRLILNNSECIELSWVPLRRQREDSRSLAIFMREPDSELTTPLSRAVRSYGLSSAEALVLGQILEGRTLSEAAGILGVARSTAKTHLDSIFRRTSTNRQTQLVRLVLGSVQGRGPS